MAELRRMYDSVDDIPETYRDLYVERDGKFVLQLSGTDPFSKPIDEFNRIYQGRERERQQREELQKQIDTIKQHFGDINDDRLEEIAEALKKADDSEHTRLINEKKFEEAAERKFHRQIAELTREIEQLKGGLNDQAQKYQNLMQVHRNVRIQDSLRSALLEAGADPKKLQWVIKAESDRWELNPDTFDPEPIEYIDNGRTKVTSRGSDGNPLTMEEQVKTLLRDNPWLALDSSGGGSSHQSSRGANGLYQIRESEVNAPGGHARYVALKEQAQKAGAELEIIQG